ncbi:Pyoverdine/dityrosine biosynthesis protein-domain-containing protein [Xylariaceae sp. FL0594]|nr:Pyoverdine/dityrosine biosynthesis protein-domain-containing protein [Xylariaceae sp. FL0594]
MSTASFRSLWTVSHDLKLEDILIRHAYRFLEAQEEANSGRLPSNEERTTEQLGHKAVADQSTKSPLGRARAAAAILNRYRIQYKNEWDIPPSVQHAESQVQQALENGMPIKLVIPAFPFKSSNRSKKVLGPVPDEAERLSLLHLNGLCLAIQDATGAKTHLTIVSDGITYNDILDVSDEEVWRYGEELRHLAKANGCHNIRFARICDLVSSGTETDDAHESETLTEELYLEKAGEYRDRLIAMTPSGFDVANAIATDPDIADTYKGYKKFLMSERDDRPSRSRSQTERENGAIAKAMIARGKAFAEAVKTKYPDSIRLSIHPSSDTIKVSIKMLPQDNEIAMTPWHGAVVRGVHGRVSMTHAIRVPAMTHEIVYQRDSRGVRRPSYFLERSHLFEWEKDVTFEYMYPCGVIVRPAVKGNDDGSMACLLSMEDMKKAQALARDCSPVILRGFRGDHNDGHEPDGKRTLFASLELLFRYMPQAYDSKKLAKMRWACYRCGSRWRGGSPLYAFPAHAGECLSRGEKIPLVSLHPITKTPYIQWCWPEDCLSPSPPSMPPSTPPPSPLECEGEEKDELDKMDPTIMIENGPKKLVQLLDSLILDRRVCLRFVSEDGDIVVGDDVSMLAVRA